MTVRRWATRTRWLSLSLLGLALAQQTLPPQPPAQPPLQAQPAVPTPAQSAPPVPPVQPPSPPAPAGPAEPDSAAAQGDQQGDQGTSVSLTRTAKDGSKRLITVLRTGSSDQTGIFTACQPLTDDPPGTPTISVFSETGAGGIRVSIDKNLIVAPLAVVTQKDSGDGHIEVSAGTARFLDQAPAGASDRLSRCEVEVRPSTVPEGVSVTQGKTRLRGSKLVYDDSDGVARIDGPITFVRDNKDTALTGSSASIEVNVDDQTTTLVGNVILKDGTRTSSAGQVEYDDAANVAILRGSAESPARTVTADQTLTARVIRYNLDTGSVVALGPIGGEFQDGEAGTPAVQPPVPASPSNSAPNNGAPGSGTPPVPPGLPRPPAGP